MTTPIAVSLMTAAGTDPFSTWSGFRSEIDVDMPVVNMAPIPVGLRDVFVGRELVEADFSYPLWAVMGVAVASDLISTDVF